MFERWMECAIYCSREIHAPPAVVWSVIRDVGSYDQVLSGVTRVERLDEHQPIAADDGGEDATQDDERSSEEESGNAAAGAKRRRHPRWDEVPNPSRQQGRSDLLWRVGRDAC